MRALHHWLRSLFARRVPEGAILGIGAADGPRVQIVLRGVDASVQYGEGRR